MFSYWSSAVVNSRPQAPGSRPQDPQVSHYLECLTVVACLRDTALLDWRGPMRRRLLLEPLRGDDLLMAAFGLDLVYYAVNACRANACMGDRRAAAGFLTARTRELHRICEPIHLVLSRALH